jgi:hypothetical protein
MDAVNKSRYSRSLDKLVFLPMLVSLIIIWGVFVKVTLIERDVTLERTKQQLETMISTLADFNELAEKTQAIKRRNTARRSLERIITLSDSQYLGGIKRCRLFRSTNQR